jgi:hypothetical protein
MARSNSKLHSDYSSSAMALWIWLALGVAAELLFPSLRSSDPRFGWLPFWFIVAPLIDLAILRRCWLAQTSRALFVRMRRLRRSARPQARRWSRRRTLRKATTSTTERMSL